MNTNKGIISILLILVLGIISSCGTTINGNNVDKAIENKENELSMPTMTITPMKSANIYKDEAKQVITVFFTALKEQDEKTVNQCVTDNLRSDEGYSNIKNATIIEIKDDIDEKRSKIYCDNRGSITKHCAVISFEVTYDMQYVDDSMSSEESGSVTKWFTLIKETETSPWQIDEWGY